MKVANAPLPGVLIIHPTLYTDDRGYFFEAFQQERYSQFGMPAFVQDNLSRSYQHVIRGLHYQLPHSQAKLVGVIQGEVWDVVVDLRRSSATFGKWFNIVLSQSNQLQLYIPPGFAHGFCVLSPFADFYYKCSQYYKPDHERGIAWNDSSLAITWPTTAPILSVKDKSYPQLRDITCEQLFS